MLKSTLFTFIVLCSFGLQAQNPPVITGFTPKEVGFGESVTITGENFDPVPENNAVLFFGDVLGIVTESTTTSLVATVPEGAASGPVRVFVNGQTAVSQEDLIIPGSISVASVAPKYGAAGTVVTLSGFGFTNVADVWLGAIQANFTIINDETVNVTVPDGAQTDRFVLLSPETVSFSAIFVVPVPGFFIESFTPQAGYPGTQVTISGEFENTSNVNLSFNGVPATIGEITNTSIVTTVPEGAVTGALYLEQNGVVVQSAEEFIVSGYDEPSITEFSPSSGVVGSLIDIYGRNFLGATSVTLGGVEMSFEVASDEFIMAVVPEGVTSGVISITTPNGTAQSSSSFTVTEPLPTVDYFFPQSAEAGAEVTISGSNFDENPTGNIVKFNDAVAHIIAADLATIVVTVPLEATTGKISVTTNTGTAISIDDFTVMPNPDGPVVNSFTPTSGSPGTTVTIEGENFSGATSLKLGDKDLSFNIESNTIITTVIPEGATTGNFKVINQKGAIQSASSFVVYPASAGRGTYLIKDIVPGRDGSNPDRLTAAGGLVYFNVREYGKPPALFRSDGTEEGTYLIKSDFELSPVDYWDQRNFADFNGNLIFSHDGEIWISDGTEAGTHELYDLNSTSPSEYTYDYTLFNGSLYFIYRKNGRKCYRWDGANMQLVYQTSSILPVRLVAAGDKLFLFEERAIYDITNGAATKVFDQNTEDVTRLIDEPFVYFNGMVLYNDRTSGGTESSARGIKYFNPVTNTVHRIANEGRIPDPGSNANTFGVTSSAIIFSSSANGNYKLWGINSDFQLSVLKEINSSNWISIGPTISNETRAVVVVGGHTLLLTDGTGAGTEVLIDEDDGITLDNEQMRYYMTDSKLFFAGNNATSGHELFTIRLDGDRIPVPVEFGENQYGNCCSQLVSIRQDEVITAATRQTVKGSSFESKLGSELWASDGSPITEEPCTLVKPQLTFDGRFLSFSGYKGVYEWYRNGVLIEGSDEFAMQPTLPGEYTLIVVVDGCRSPQSDPYKVEGSGTVTSTEPDVAESIQVYPNPSSKDVSIRISNLGSRRAHGILTDQLGRTIKVIEFADAGYILEATVEMSALRPGIYYCNIITPEGSAVVKIFRK